jgi:hypothetical protein
MRVIPPMLAGLMALAAPSVQAAPNPNENWRSLNPPLSLSLGDQACGEGWHQALRGDWRGEWWWGPCAPNR